MGIRSGQTDRSRDSAAARGAYRQSAYYVDGNTVRKAEPQAAPVPYRRPYAGERIAPAAQQARRPRLSYEQQKRNARLARTATTRLSASVNLSLTLLLAFTVFVSMLIGCDYLRLKASIDTHMDSIKSMETRLESLRNENDALEGSIDTSIDLNHIYSVAVEELGMVPASQSNIIQYDKTESEYVRQYEDIPASGQ